MSARSRLDTLIVVRRVVARGASDNLARAVADARLYESLAQRLDAADAASVRMPCTNSGAAIVSQLELEARMRAVRQDAAARANAAEQRCAEAGEARRLTRRSLDAALDIRRVKDRVTAVRREHAALPVVPVRERGEP